MVFLWRSCDWDDLLILKLLKSHLALITHGLFCQLISPRSYLCVCRTNWEGVSWISQLQYWDRFHTATLFCLCSIATIFCLKSVKRFTVLFSIPDLSFNFVSRIVGTIWAWISRVTSLDSENHTNNLYTWRYRQIELDVMFAIYL